MIEPIANRNIVIFPSEEVIRAAVEASKQAERLSNKIKVEKMKFEVTSIHITNVGPSGTCPGSLAELLLNGTLAR